MELEFNAEQKRMKSIENLTLTVVFPVHEKPIVKSTENSDYAIEHTELAWRIAKLQEDGNATIEVQFGAKANVDQFFPINVSFSSENSMYYQMRITKVTNIANGQDINFDV